MLQYDALVTVYMLLALPYILYDNYMSLPEANESFALPRKCFNNWD